MSAMRFIVSLQLREQREAVVAQPRVVGHDHDAVEESVDRRLSAPRASSACPYSPARRNARRPALRARGELARRALFRAARPAAPRRTAAGTRAAFLRMLPMRLLAAARLGASGSVLKIFTASSWRGTRSTRVGPQREHGVDLARRVAALPRNSRACARRKTSIELGLRRPRASYAGVESRERARRRARTARAAARARPGCASRPAPARRKPNGSLSPVGSWPMPKMPRAFRACRRAPRRTPTCDSRQRVAGEARPVVRFDRVGDGLRLAVVQRVVAAHDALQLGKLADHAGEQVGLGEPRGALGGRGIDAERARDRPASRCMRSTRSSWVPSLL